VYDASTGALLETLADGDAQGVADASFGLRDRWVATASEDGEVRLWTTPQPQVARSTELAPAAAAGFAVSGNTIVEAGIPGDGEVLDAHTLRPLSHFALPAGYSVLGAGASHNGQLLAALGLRVRAGTRTITGALVATFDARSGRRLATVALAHECDPHQRDAQPRRDPARHPRRQRRRDGMEWNAHSDARVRIIRGREPAVLAAFSPDGAILAIVHEPALPATLTFRTQQKLGDVTIDLRDARSGRRLRLIDGPQVVPVIDGVAQFAPLAVAFSANSHALALVGADQFVHVWSTHRSGEARLAVPGDQFAVSVAFSPNDDLLAAGTAAGAYVWRGASPTPLAVFQHADPSQFTLANRTAPGGVLVGFTGARGSLASAGDGEVEAWDIADHLQVFAAPAVHGSTNLAGSEVVGTVGRDLSLYRCELCGGLSELLAAARRDVTRGLSAGERDHYLASG